MSNNRQLRIDTLKTAARRKSEEKVKAAEEAIRQLAKRGELVTFQAVQRQASVSQNFLYKNPTLRSRIEHQRRAHRPPPQPVPAQEGDNNIVVALTAEISRLKKRLHTESTELRKALEEAHGENLTLRRELERRGRTP